ncbi:MAG: septal ring lytic transglycosylase RlpA family protein [Halioglobus sp.]
MIVRGLCCVIAICAMLLFGCTATPPPAPESRYGDAHDAAPLKAVNAADVADATPRPDPILAVGNKSPYTVNDVTYEVLQDYRNYRERGIASWYGAKFNGHETSNGEIFDLYQASAAHKTLPIPSYARVTNLDNGKSVVVRINDRGPFHSERLIDLSYGAAVKLGYMESGTAPVEVEVLDIVGVDDRRDATSGNYRYLQLGAFGTENSAQQLRGKLQALLSAPVFISEVEAGGSLLYRVRIGPVADNDELLVVQQQLQDGGYEAGQPLP